MSIYTLIDGTSPLIERTLQRPTFHIVKPPTCLREGRSHSEPQQGVGQVLTAVDEIQNREEEEFTKRIMKL